VESAATKQQGIMGNPGEFSLYNKARRKKPGMSVELLMSPEEFGFHLVSDVECILTRFKT
jgi:hypothetical protein